MRPPAGTSGANSGVRPPAGPPQSSALAWLDKPSATTSTPAEHASRGASSSLERGPQVQPPDALDNANELALPVLTLQELQRRRRQSGVGGKMACQEQRRLRQDCFQRQVYELDMTCGTWPWQDLLKNLLQAAQGRLGSQLGERGQW